MCGVDGLEKIRTHGAILNDKQINDGRNIQVARAIRRGTAHWLRLFVWQSAEVEGHARERERGGKQRLIVRFDAFDGQARGIFTQIEVV